MTTETLLFAFGSREAFEGPLSPDDLWMPLGSESVIARYVRGLRAQGGRVHLLTATDIDDGAHDELRGLDAETHTFSEERAFPFRGELEANSRPVIMLNGRHLPGVELDAIRRQHERSGVALSIHFTLAKADPCHERVVVTEGGHVEGIARDYGDSPGRPPRRIPLAIVASQNVVGSMRFGATQSFCDWVDEFEAYVSGQGEAVKWSSDTSVSACLNRMDALHRLIAPTHTGKGHEVPHDAAIDPTARIIGPLLIGHNVRIQPGAIVIGPTAIGDRVIIESGSLVTDSVVLPDVTVPRKSAHYRRIVGPTQSGQCDKEEWQDPYASTNASLWQSDSGHAPARSPSREWIKRLFDVLASGAGLVVLWPILVLITLAIKCTSRGPVFYSQRRQGRDGMEFDCWKFRTMVQDADSQQAALRALSQVDGPQFKIEDDPRVTRIGRLLRATNLDELPQLINVLRGEMSLVGPRPSPDRENQWCPAWRRARLSVRPGITGLWQMMRSDDRGTSDFQEWIYYDLRYVENRSFRLDLEILCQTVRVLLGLRPSLNWRRRWLPKCVVESNPGGRVAGRVPDNVLKVPISAAAGVGASV